MLFFPENSQKLSQILRHWTDRAWKHRSDLTLHGSPERCHYRFGIELDSGELCILEAVSLRKQEMRIHQAQVLSQLHDNGLSLVVPWQSTATGSPGVTADGHFWQFRSYLPCTPFPRDQYGDQPEYGLSLGTALLNLHSAARQLSSALFQDEKTFFLTDYVHQALLPEIKEKNHPLFQDLIPIVDTLSPFWEMEKRLPVSFSHGDFHPGNVLWNQTDAYALIDWEFCGRKCCLYDAANFLGCLGMDAPAWLTAPCAAEFLKQLWKPESGIPTDVFQYLPDLMAALRFGWLREWFVHDDREMLCQELDFIWLLLDNRELLRKHFCNALFPKKVGFCGER